MRQFMIGAHPKIPDAWILIEESVIGQIGKYRQLRRDSPEAGGILLGFRRGSHVHVTDFTTPQVTDRGTRTRFSRDERGHSAIAWDRWILSGGTCDYLGEWHTHPEVHPRPSALDLREWRQLLRFSVAPLVFLIVGTGSSWLGLGDGASISRVIPDV